MPRLLPTALWSSVVFVFTTPVLVAVASPYTVGRDAIYILGALGGIIALSLLLLQPLLAAGYLSGISATQGRRWHQRLGILLTLAVAAHIIGLYFTSPMDMTDALLLAAPTPFSIYGFIALWSMVATVLLVALRARFRASRQSWMIAHNALAVVVVATTVAHALMIDGLMGSKSKLMICICAMLATSVAVIHLRILKAVSKYKQS